MKFTRKLKRESHAAYFVTGNKYSSMTPFTLSDPITNKVLLKFDLPGSWQEITLGQMILWEQECKSGLPSFTKQLEILTGIPETDWMNCTILSIDQMLMPHMDWLNEPLQESDFTSLEVPEKVTIEGKEYAVPKDLDLKTFGQKITFQSQMGENVIRNEAEEITGFKTEFFPTAIAIYLCPSQIDPEDGKLKWKDVTAFEFAEKVKALPLFEAWPIATFFLHRFIASLSATVNT